MTFAKAYMVDDYRFDRMVFNSRDDAVAVAEMAGLENPGEHVVAALVVPDLDDVVGFVREELLGDDRGEPCE